MQDWCDECGSTANLTANHIIPVSVRPEWEYLVENINILCRSCNGRRGSRYTDAEYEQVSTRIANRRPPRVIG